MAIYVGPGIADWPLHAPGDVCWLTSAPLVANAAYPPILDLADAAGQMSNPVVARACEALAPCWERFTHHQLTSSLEDLPPDERGAFLTTVLTTHVEAGDSSLFRFCVETLGSALASLGPGFGAVLRRPTHWDSSSRLFVRRLLHASSASGFHIAIEASPNALRRHPEFREIIARATIVPERLRPNVSPVDADHPLVRFLALCPHGLPRDVADQIAPGSPRGVLGTIGPGGREWVYLRPTVLRIVSREIPLPVRRSLHDELFDAWPCTGYDYLRRGAHAVAACDAPRLLRQHLSYVSGMIGISSTFVYRHMVALCERRSDLAIERKDVAKLLTTTGELANTLPIVNAHDLAIAHIEGALAFTDDPAHSVSVMCELSNSYAFKRTAQSLRMARHWCENAKSRLSAIGDPQEHVLFYIRVANAFALVEYREGHRHKALEIELAARELAGRNGERDQKLKRWARDLLNRNIAQLLERSFLDPARAIEFLTENVQHAQNVITRDVDILTLARLHFDLREHKRVVELLAPFYEQHAQSHVFNENSELLGRAMFAISLGNVGDHDRALVQLRHLQLFASAVNAPGAERLSLDLRAQFGPRTRGQAVEDVAQDDVS